MPHTMVLPDSAPPASLWGRAQSAPLAPSTTFRNTSGEVLSVRGAPRRRGLLLVGGVALLALGAFAATQFLDAPPGRRRRLPVSTVEPPPEQPPPPPARLRREIRATPAEASIKIDGQELGPSPVVTEVARGAHELVISAPGYRPVTIEFADDSALPPLIELAREAPPQPPPSKPPRPPKQPKSHRPRPVAAPADQPARRGVNDAIIIE
jgi:hypothetical protein